MTLSRRLRDPLVRSHVAADAVREAEAAVAERSGFRGVAAQVGLDTINRVRPGFLERHVHELLPNLAKSLEDHWATGLATGDPCLHLESNADDVSIDLLEVVDAYVDNATDETAIAVYQRLRGRAPRRVAEQMPRIANFVERHHP